MVLHDRDVYVQQLGHGDISGLLWYLWEFLESWVHEVFHRRWTIQDNSILYIFCSHKLAFMAGDLVYCVTICQLLVLGDCW